MMDELREHREIMLKWEVRGVCGTLSVFVELQGGTSRGINF